MPRYRIEPLNRRRLLRGSASLGGLGLIGLGGCATAQGPAGRGVVQPLAPVRAELQRWCDRYASAMDADNARWVRDLTPGLLERCKAAHAAAAAVMPPAAAPVPSDEPDRWRVDQ